jgi:hypothetical protein
VSRRKLLTSLLCLWALSIAHCGGASGLNDKMEMSLLPQSPIVIDADLTLFAGTEDERVIKAPWFLLNLEFVNNATAETLWVVTVDFKITGVNGTKRVYIDPTVTCKVDNESRAYITILAPGATFIANDDGTDYCDPEINRSTGEREGWFIDGLPGKTGQYNYSVFGTAKGWIADSTGTPIERLLKSGMIITQ